MSIIDQYIKSNSPILKNLADTALQRMSAVPDPNALPMSANNAGDTTGQVGGYDTSMTNASNYQDPSFMEHIHTILGKNPQIGQFLLGMGGAMAAGATQHMDNGRLTGGSFGSALGEGIQGGSKSAQVDLLRQSNAADEMNKFKASNDAALQQHLALKESDRNELFKTEMATALGNARIIAQSATPENLQKFPLLRVAAQSDPRVDPIAYNKMVGQVVDELAKSPQPTLSLVTNSYGEPTGTFNIHTGEVGGLPGAAAPTSNTPAAAAPSSDGNLFAATSATAPSTTPNPGETKAAFEARMRQQADKAQLDATSVENQRQEQVKNRQAINIEQMKLEAPKVTALAEEQPSTYAAIDDFSRLERLAKKSNTGVIAGSEIGQKIRGLFNDTDFQELQSGAREVTLKRLKYKLGAQVSNADVTMLLTSIFDPTKEPVVNVGLLQRARKGMMAQAAQDRRTLADYQKKYETTISGYNPDDYKQYHDYPKQVKIGGQVLPVEAYDPATKQYLINGEWGSLQ